MRAPRSCLRVLVLLVVAVLTAGSVPGVAVPAAATPAPSPPRGWTATAGTLTAAGEGLRLSGDGRAVAVLTVLRTVDSRVRAAVRVVPRRTTTVSVGGRRVPGRGEYRVEARTDAGGRSSLVLVRQAGARSRDLASAPLARGLADGRVLHVRLEVSGTSPTRLAARGWPAGTAEPRGWQVSASDATAALQVPGSPALAVRVPGRRPAVAVVGSWQVERPETVTPPAASDPADPADPADAAAPPVPLAPPGPGTTGVPAGTVLRVHHGDLTVSRAGTVVDGLDVHGFVRVTAPDVVIRRSVVRGGVATGNTGLISNLSHSATGLLVEDVVLRPDRPSVWVDGVKGGNVTVRRADISGVVDGVKVHGDDVVVEDSWIHDLADFASDPNQGGRATHNDGVQVLGGARVTVRRTRISGASNAAVQVTQDAGPVTDLALVGNLLDGGGCTVNLAAKPLPSLEVEVRDNRFGRATRHADCALIASRTTTVRGQGGTWVDTGSPVRQRNGG